MSQNTRDYFAGLAMQAIMQSEAHMETAEKMSDMSKDELSIQEAIAMLAYVQAEYMIQFKKKVDKQEEKKDE